MSLDWRGRKVVIIGAARQGLALARYLLQRGAAVTLTDQKPVEKLASAQQALADLNDLPLEWVCGGHPLTILDGADILCVSGGVPLTLPLVVEAQRRGLPVLNDSLIFMEAVPCKVIGITGSAGKTTTTTLVGRMAQAALDMGAPLDPESPGLQGQVSPQRAPKVWVGGNIGLPLITLLDDMRAGDLCVMELSSFQLEIMDISPQIAVVLNITPNHLDRHRTMEAYTAAKAHILEFQSAGDVAVLGRDDPGAWSLAGRVKGKLLSFGLSELPAAGVGAFYQDGSIYLRQAPGMSDVRVLKRDDISLRGEHNLLNVMAACTVASAVSLPVEAMLAGVSGFRGVPHRLEFVRSFGGADWYNDSIATAPERSMAAIHAFKEPLVLLAGGRDKDLPWDDFASLVRQRVDHLIVFGEASGIILAAMEKESHNSRPGNGVTRLQSLECYAGLEEAVQAASRVAQPGDVVLLSPGGTSFDEFKDFEERGEWFTRWVKALV